jgi:putative nucleotidyltransferase with HDIG domain
MEVGVMELATLERLSEVRGGDGNALLLALESAGPLGSKLLRLAGGAFFGQADRVRSLPRALVLLGAPTVRNLAVGVGMWDTLAAGVGTNRAAELWQHALAVGVATKVLAARLRCAEPDEAFAAGLLHDVGRLVLAERFAASYWEVVGGADEHEVIERRERAAFGVDHAEVGAWMLEGWRVPPALVAAVGEHHAGAPGSPLARVLHVADRLVEWTDRVSGALQAPARALLERGIAPGVTVALWEEVVEHVRHARRLA